LVVILFQKKKEDCHIYTPTTKVTVLQGGRSKTTHIPATSITTKKASQHGIPSIPTSVLLPVEEPIAVSSG
jgi:hypothetical protein